MRLEIFLNIFGLCSVLVCLSDGSPMKAGGKYQEKSPFHGRNTGPPYTIEEENFLFSKIEACTNPYSLPTWAGIARAHKLERERNTKGFIADRTRHTLRTHFFNRMVKKDEQNNYPARVPDSVKKVLQNRKYTQEEDDFIITELFLRKSTKLNSRKLWAGIKEKHDQLLALNVPGFKKKRTGGALCKRFNDCLKSHFLRMQSAQSECANCTSETKQGGVSKDTSSQAKNQCSEEKALHKSGEETDEDLVFFDLS